MLTKRPAPVIGKFSNSIMSSGFRDASGSSKYPSDCKILSPRGPINHDLNGIGLGIVAAMEKYVDGGRQAPSSKVLCRRNSSPRSNPIPVNSPKNSTANRGVIDDHEVNSLEDYTFVTGIGPDNKKFARVYYDGENQRRDFDRRRSTRNNPSIFTVSPAGFDDFADYPASDFLSCCHMCRKKLHGKDIYMYRGDKSFCSTECRYRQIVMDEKKEKEKEKEKCSSKFASRSSIEVSGFSCNNGRVFSPGIFAI